MRRLLRTLFVLSTGLVLTGCGLLGGASSKVIQSSQADPPVKTTQAASPPGSLPPAEVRVIPAETQPGSRADIPTSTAESAATSTVPPAPPTPRPLTQGGCCVNPYWSADSQRLLYFDRPTPLDQAGIWSIDLQGGAPEFVTAQWAVYSSDQMLRALPEAGQTIVERISDGQRWQIPSDGRSVVFSKDGTQVGWTAGRNQPPFDSAMRQIWVSRSDGSSPHQVMSVLSGGISDWFPDGRLLVSGRLEDVELGQALWVLTPPADEGGNWEAAELVQAERIRGAVLSPDGSWLAYVSAFSGDPTQDGLWLLNTLSGEKRRLEIFGAYRWRDTSRLLVIPLEMDQPSQRLLQVEPASMEIEPLTDPRITALKIANGDWSVSPDGSHLAFVSAVDGNIWVIDLP